MRSQQPLSPKRSVKDKSAFLERQDHPLLSLGSLVAVLFIWEIISRLGIVSPLFLPAPSKVFMAGWELILTGRIIEHLRASLWRICWGFSGGAAIGIGMGILLGISSLSDSVMSPLIATTYPIPKIAILPLLILWLGIGEMSKIMVIALGVFFPLVINVRSGVREVDPNLIKAALSMGSSHLGIVRKVILPGSLPMIFAGLKLGIGIALLLVVTAEMIAADAGIGFMILTAADLMQTPQLLFGIFLLSALGLLFAWSLEILERLVIRWKR